MGVEISMAKGMVRMGKTSSYYFFAQVILLCFRYGQGR